MVAYRFKKQFSDLILLGGKWQTVRAHRRYHARPGETLQPYICMCTRTCYKLMGVVCIPVDTIEIAVTDLMSTKVANIILTNIPLIRAKIEAFMRVDGFRSEKLDWSARHRLGAFFHAVHGVGTFKGVVIHWKPKG